MQFEKKAGSMKGKQTLYMIGNSHIDPVWLWRWQNGFQEIKATFRSALDRMKEYPEFIYTCSAASYYQWIEQNDPAMFEEIRARVKEGRWVLAGGWWVQPDCNTPSGESFARQSLYSQRYFREKFGMTAKFGYCVDSFGHNAMLPQILRKSGMNYYVFMRPQWHEKTLPLDTFRWRSADGSEVVAGRLPVSYQSGEDSVRDKVQICIENLSAPLEEAMCFYGVGNHGGGPTKRNIESILSMQKEENGPKLVFASPEDYFHAAEKRELPVYRGELLHHSSGCYSAHSEIKALNRKAENRAEKAEKFSVLAHSLLGQRYPLEEYRRAWEDILFNQFHDVLAGTCLREAYDDARDAFGEALAITGRGLNAAVQRLSWNINIEKDETMKPLVVFNPHSFPVRCAVKTESTDVPEHTLLTDESGNPVPSQLSRSSAATGDWCLVFTAELPAFGWRVYKLHALPEENELPEKSALDDCTAENESLSLHIDPESGSPDSLILKKTGAEILGGKCRAAVIDDPSDAWSHGVRVFDREAGCFRAVSVRKIEDGPARTVIRAISGYGASSLIQDFIVARGLDHVEVDTEVNWQETQKMLKLRFPVGFNSWHAVYEIPYGTVERALDGEEYPVQSWMDLSGGARAGDGAYGLSVLNDCKYACSAVNGELSLTVLRSPYYAHHAPYEAKPEYNYPVVDRGVQRFTYELYPHEGSLGTETARKAMVLNQKPEAIFETFHEGCLPQKASFAGVSGDSVVITALKLAEDGSGDVILRLFETAGKAAEADVKLSWLSRELHASFAPHEIKTFRIPEQAEKPIMETNLLEDAVPAGNAAAR